MIRGESRRTVAADIFHFEMITHYERGADAAKFRELMNSDAIQWYAIKARRDSKAAEGLAEVCEEVFFPIEKVKSSSGVVRQRAIIPKVLFIRTTHDRAIEFERESYKEGSRIVPFRIYRYQRNYDIQPIPDDQIRLIRLLTTDESERCEVFTKADFKRGQMVRVKDGKFKGYTGTVQRVKKNKHVLVEIEGVCMILLPFIHPDLLEPI